MAGILFLAVLGGYIFVLILLVYGSVKVAKKAGRNPWLPGISVALFMYLLIFWDFIPVLVKHHNLCKEQGGVWIYKSPEQWIKENPDAIGKRWAKPGESLRTEHIENGTRDWISDYVYYESYFENSYAHAIRKYESKVIDARTGEVLTRVVNFERGAGNFMLRTDSIVDYKLWLGAGNNNCGTTDSEYLLKFVEISKRFNLLGEVKNAK